MRRALLTLFPICIFCISQISLAGGYASFISKEIQDQHPSLKFDVEEEGDEWAHTVWLPVDGRKVGVRLYHNAMIPMLMDWDNGGYVALELVIDGATYQIGSRTGYTKDWREAFLLKGFMEKTSFEEPVHRTNFALSQMRNNRSDAEPSRRLPDVSVLPEKLIIEHHADHLLPFEKPECTRIQPIMIEGLPVAAFFTILQWPRSDISTRHYPMDAIANAPYVYRLLLPGWLLEIDSDVVSAPEMVRLKRIKDIDPLSTNIYSRDRADCVNIVPVEVRRAWEESDNEDELRDLIDLTDPETISIEMGKQEIEIRQYIDARSLFVQVVSFTGSHYYSELPAEVLGSEAETGFEISVNGELLQFAHHLPDDPAAARNRIKYWLAEKNFPAVYGTMESLAKVWPKKFQVRVEPGWPVNRGMELLQFSKHGIKISVGYEREQGSYAGPRNRIIFMLIESIWNQSRKIFLGFKPVTSTHFASELSGIRRIPASGG